MNREQIEDLLKHYLDGETTNEEEQLLRQYFVHTQIVPSEWNAYKALFCWEESMRQSATTAHAASAPVVRKRRMLIAAAIAALIVIGAGITTRLLSPSSNEQQANYAVLDGRYTTDKAVIAREAEEALLLVSSSDEDTFDAIDILDIP